jgi:hypothetical protein
MFIFYQPKIGNKIISTCVDSKIGVKFIGASGINVRNIFNSLTWEGCDGVVQ